MLGRYFFVKLLLLGMDPKFCQFDKDAIFFGEIGRTSSYGLQFLPFKRGEKISVKNMNVYAA